MYANRIGRQNGRLHDSGNGSVAGRRAERASLAPPTVEDFLTPRKSQGYRIPSVLGGWVNHAIDDRPVFTWLQADRMRRDPQVDFGLRIVRTPVYGATWDVKCKRTEVAAFVHGTLQKFWQRCLRKVFRFFEYGVSVGEITHKLNKGLVHLDRLDDFHPRDTRPLEFRSGPYRGNLAGIRLHNVAQDVGATNILPPHCWWFSGDCEYGSLYGRPRLAGAYEPWLEKRGRNGATDSRRLWYKKCAFRGGVMRHPPGVTDVGGDSGSILQSNQDLAREICEKFENGGILAMLNVTDQNGNYLWTYEPPASHPDVAGLREYPKDLDREILIGLGIPPELVEAATVGSGYSGRAIPAQVFFTMIDEIVSLIIETVDRQIVRPLVVLNFGPVPYQILPRSLAKLVTQDKPSGPDLDKNARRQDDPQGGGGGGGQGGARGRDDKTDAVQLSDALVNRVKALADQEYPDLGPVDLSFDESKVNREPEIRRAIYDVMLQAAERVQSGDNDAQDELDALADLAADHSELSKSIDLSWVSHGESRTGKPRWKNTETGRIRYQQSKPGEVREKRQASEKRARELADEMQSHLLHPEDFAAPTPEKWQELADNLPALSVDTLKSVRNRLLLSAPDAKRHAQLVEAIKAHIASEPKPAEKPESKPAAKPDAAPKNPTPGKVYNVATNELHVDPERFQFKLNVKGPEGVGEELKGVDKFNPDFAGVISVWKDPADGKTYVINGHHRHELANRTGHPSLAVRYIDAPDAVHARGKGALINIAEGRGTAVDAAKFMRDTGTTPEDFSGQGISLKGQVARDAAVLMNLSDPLFSRVSRGTLEIDRALAIAAHLPDKDKQTELLNYIEREEDKTGKEYPPRIVAEAAQEMAATPTVAGEGPDLFGEVNDKSVFMQRSELKAHVRAELAKELRDFQAVASQRRADAVAGAGNTLNVEGNREKAKAAENRVDTFSRLASYKGELSDLLNEQAEKYANAKNNRERDAIRRETTDRVRTALSQIEQRGIPAVGEGS